MRATRKALGLVLFVFICTSAPPAMASNGWNAVIRPTVGAGTGTADYTAELFAPLYQTNSSMIFITPRFRYNAGLNDENEVNVGLGYRRLTTNDGWFVGGNVYYDTMDSSLQNRYNQIGVGLEARSREFDVFLNGYIPVGTTKYRQASLDRFSLSGHNLMRRSGEEEALAGLDGEVGALIPYVSDYVETRAYVGSYYWTSDVGSDICGVKGRVQVNPVPLVTVNGTYSYDHVRNSDWRGEAYLNIPFSVTNIFEGKNPFAGLSDAIAFGKGARGARARMTDRVERDRFVQTVSGADEKAVKVHAMIYVDNSTTVPVADQDGSLKRPYSSIAQAQAKIATLTTVKDLPYVYVFAGLSNSGTPYTGGLDFNLGEASTLTSRSGCLWGEDYALPGMRKGAMPLIDGGDFGVSLDGLAGGGALSVLGMAITNTGAVIGANPLSVEAQFGTGIYGTDLLAANIIGNTITGNSGDGVQLSAGASGAVPGAQKISQPASSNINISIKGNIIDNNYGDGINYNVTKYNGGNIKVDISGNPSISNNQYGSGIYGVVDNEGAGDVNVTITGNNAISNNGCKWLVSPPGYSGYGIYTDTEEHGNGSLKINIIGNAADDNYLKNIYAFAYSSAVKGDFNLDISGNDAGGSKTEGGILAYAINQATGKFNITMDGNAANYNYGDNIHIEADNYGNGNTKMHIIGNQADGSISGNGIYACAGCHGGSGGTALILENNESNFNNAAIDPYLGGMGANIFAHIMDGGDSSTLVIAHNNAGYSEKGYGICAGINNGSNGNVNLNILDNTSNYNYGTNINAYVANDEESAGSTSLSLLRNQASGSETGDGIYASAVNSVSTGSVSLKIGSNTSGLNHGYGIYAEAESVSGGSASLVMDKNTALTNGNEDFYLYVHNDATGATDNISLSGSGNVLDAGSWAKDLAVSGGAITDTLVLP